MSPLEEHWENYIDRNMEIRKVSLYPKQFINYLIQNQIPVPTCMNALIQQPNS